MSTSTSSLVTSEDLTSAGTTWYNKTFFKSSGSAVKASTVDWGNLSNASLVGAKTVKGPSPLRVSAKPALTTKSTKVVAPSRVKTSGRLWLRTTEAIARKTNSFMMFVSLCCSRKIEVAHYEAPGLNTTYTGGPWQ